MQECASGIVQEQLVSVWQQNAAELECFRFKATIQRK